MLSLTLLSHPFDVAAPLRDATNLVTHPPYINLILTYADVIISKPTTLALSNPTKPSSTLDTTVQNTASYNGSYTAIATRQAES
ncbi:unnamed protein product [Dovyalis caffra]|uniref:Uncharacterized protein n=1 Tax=Dovyalis caffra TaxID=77055 RepID=A0AAV1RC94_9ROSI|nr:unnamed protein product [Dovyalis caffra]